MELILVVLMSFLPMTGLGESEVIGSHEPVHVVVGDDAILPCHLEPPFNVMNLTVEWNRNKTKVHVYRSRKDDPSLQDKQFKGRTFLFHDNMANGNISLKLTNVTEKDTGNYICFVPKLQSQVKRGNVTLIVGHSVGIAIGVIFVIAIVIVGAILFYLKRENCSGMEDLVVCLELYT
eukprot:superscaffoldBa00005337_g20210